MTTIEFSHQVAGLRGALQSFTRRFTLDREESRDLVQDTMLKALLHRDKFRENTNLKGWLFIIMRNTFINNYRKTRRKLALRTQSNEHQLRSREDEHTFSKPHENLEFKEIWTNINNLRQELMLPFKMHSSGYKYHEIAETLGIPLGTVKNRIFHARKEIQKNLQGY
ncbi:MAG TPA: RNA polymerase sigma factor [Chryseolinea sp.]|nr:RNA polymerase sigma factor [Chryseolinea sp.]